MCFCTSHLAARCPARVARCPRPCPRPRHYQTLIYFNLLSFFNLHDGFPTNWQSGGCERRLLICGVKNVSSVLEQTRLSQSQSPSPLCADTNKDFVRGGQDKTPTQKKLPHGVSYVAPLLPALSLPRAPRLRASSSRKIVHMHGIGGDGRKGAGRSE